MRKLTLFAAVAGLATATAAYGQTWDEAADGGGDAGDLLPTAQLTLGVGPLTTITGNMPDGLDIDMFCITVTDFASFSAEVIAGGTTVSDTQLYLFDDTGTGIVFNDDKPSGGLLSILDGTHVNANGTYYLVMADFDVEAINPDGDDIWHDGSPFDGQYAPDGPGAGNPVLDHWGATSSFGGGDYEIALTGAGYHDVPAPGALALLGLAGLAGLQRRRV